MAMKNLTVRIPESTYEAIAREAEKQAIGIADLVRKAISERLEADHLAQRFASMEARLSEQIQATKSGVISHIDDRCGRIKTVVDGIAKGAAGGAKGPQ